MQIYWKKKEGSNVRKNVTSAGAVVWDTNMAMVLLFCDANMAMVLLFWDTNMAMVLLFCDANITNLAFVIGLY